MVRKILFIIFCSVSLFGQAQDQAYYLSTTNGADLLLVDIHKDCSVLNQAFVFEDSIKISNMPQPLYFPPRFPNFLYLEDKVDENQFLVSPFNFRLTDSIYFEGKWHTIEYKHYDDNFLGGRPNQVDDQVSVNDIGIIYSSSNFITQHVTFMLCHNNVAKHRLLQAVYRHLQTKSSWIPYKAIADLVAKYSFGDCLTTLGEECIKMRNHLRIVSYHAETIDGMDHLDVTIKNTSGVAYAIPSRYKFAPSKAEVYYEDKTTTWNLLETHDGVHFREISQTIYLSPGEEVEFSHVFSTKYGCGGCDKIMYSGFQIYGGRPFFDWMVGEKIIHNGKPYTVYPCRDILDARNN